jgi:hypothetical protein
MHIIVLLLCKGLVALLFSYFFGYKINVFNGFTTSNSEKDIGNIKKKLQF